MFKLAAVLALAAVASAASVEMQMDTMRSFTQWKRDYAAVYETAEAETAAFHNFQERMAFINKHNAEAAEGKHTYTVGVNQFMDLSQQDFKRFYTSRFNRTTARNTVYLPAATEDSVDWRSKGAVTPIKNQGQCGSCWSFSTTGSTEGAHAIASGKLVSLSEQQLCDCSTSYGNQGCNGGLMDNAFKYIIANGGLDTEEDYPYTARDGTCDKTKAAKKVVSITGYQDVPQNNEDQLAAAVAKGPVSVAIEADQMGFQQYTSGVFSGPCGTQLDHGVLVVGYSDDYWIVKNSWGASWGDQGYIMMKRGVSASGICGIAMQPSYPTAGAPGPSPPPPPGPSPPPPPPPGPSPPPPPGNYDYEKPNPGCHAGEEAIQVTGVPGDFCSPKCTGVFNECPKNVPPGTTATPKCVLESQGSSKPTLCALICDPSGSDKCPSGATCQSIQGTGLCTYGN